MALTNWQSIGIFWYLLGEIWFKWIFSDTVTLQWHSGSALGGLKFCWFCNSSRCWLIGRFPLIKGNDRLAILPMTSLTQEWSIGTGMVNWNSIGNVGNISNSSRCWLIGRFPLIKGNDRLASLSMKLYYRDWVPWNDSLLDWHRIGQLTLDWSIGTGMVNWNSIGNVGILAIHRGVG